MANPIFRGDRVLIRRTPRHPVVLRTTIAIATGRARGDDVEVSHISAPDREWVHVNDIVAVKPHTQEAIK